MTNPDSNTTDFWSNCKREAIEGWRQGWALIGYLPLRFWIVFGSLTILHWIGWP
jgi:hypothetical protein